MEPVLLRVMAVVAFSGLSAPCLTAAPQRGALFDNVVEALADDYYDRGFCRSELPRLARRYRSAARSAASRDAERLVVHDFLGEIPVSHLALYSSSTYRRLMKGLRNERAPTFGLQLRQDDGLYIVCHVLEDGPADRAGVRRGDRLLWIDGEHPADSPRLDWRNDDAYLPDLPRHGVLCKRVGDHVELEVERRPGDQRVIAVESREYSAFDAAQASELVYARGGKRFGYLHFWYMHHDGVVALLERCMRGPFATCDGLILDLRGRGGSAATAREVGDLLGRWSLPVVALIDRDTRSAKELLAGGIKKKALATLVGERTAGAVIPASFVDVGFESVLMFPKHDMKSPLEGNGVVPDVHAARPGMYSAGSDPILERGIEVLVRGGA